MTSVPDTVRQQTQGSPLVAGAIVFGVGVLAASVVKPSEMEQQAAGQLRDKVEPLKDELKQTGQDMAEHMKQPLSDAADQVKEAAAEASHPVTDAAKDAAGTSKRAVREAADTVRSEATDGGENRQPI